MKILLVEEAQRRLAVVCEEASAGEVVRLQLNDGSFLELTRVPAVPQPAALSEQRLAESYDDAEWAAFENHCAKASD